MTTSDERRFPAVAALLAALVGLVLISIAAVRLASGDSTGTAASPTSISVASTTTAAEPAVSTSNPTLAADFAPGAVVLVTDDSGSISAILPAEWADVSGVEWVVDNNRVGPSITAAPDIDAWYASWGTPGVFVGVSTSSLAPEPGDFSGICSLGELEERSAGVLAGTVQAWSDCGAEGGDFYVFVGGPPDSSWSVLVQLVDVDGSGRATLDQILTTFSYET
jgi:serine protease Do